MRLSPKSRLWQRMTEELRRQKWTMLAGAITFLICSAIVFLLIWPAYTNPKARMYTSKLGYASILRKTGRAFPVRTAIVEEREIEARFLGEGLVQSEPVQVPMIGMARIEEVRVEEGDFVRAGDVVVVLDDSRIRNKIAAAKAALTNAEAELRRVSIGTVNVLEKERPDRERIRLDAMKRETEILEKLLASYRDLGHEKFVSEQEVLQKELETVRASASRDELQLNTNIAEEGLKESIRMAESSIREAALQVEHRELELLDYLSLAPSDGVVERVLVHAGEYNQDPGRPAVLLASGLWFEVFFDQTAIDQIHVGTKVEVRLAAFQSEVFEATITKIRPLVHFSSGGPETNRPIRPLGTGAPEWPATFSARATFINPSRKIVPGLTGFARATVARKSTCVPVGTVIGVSAKRGIVLVVDESGDRFETRNVTVAETDGNWIEVVDGLKVGDRVIVDGHQILEPGDAIECQEIPSADTEHSVRVVSNQSAVRQSEEKD